MTVKELKENLAGIDDNIKVFALDDMGGYFPIFKIKQVNYGNTSCLFLDGLEEDEDEEENN